ncbi:hypothetical protein M405DRAFT_887063 [Rhizopogon salebrosus TDB-379]|nr:hypothetical protein M405DRAFT_887063 [Rhizopogon salebrosus TDB-379]
MASKSDLDSKADTDLPPSYDTTPASATPLGTPQSIQSKRPSARSVFFSDVKKQAETYHSDVIPSSVVPIVNSCAADISPAEFSDLLQSLNIGDHTAMYWAIMNNRRETLLALSGYISKISPVCSSDLRLACMATSNQALFMQLNLSRSIGPDDEFSLRSLNCPPDEIEVHQGYHDKSYKHQFVTLIRFHMCQKRLRTIQNMSVEFVVGGRIWWLRIYMGSETKWCMKWGLSEPSLPACHADAKVCIVAHGGKPGCANPTQ